MTIMTNDNEPSPCGKSLLRQPWNNGMLVEPKPPPRAGHAFSIRTRLQLEGKMRDLTQFNLAIDSKLRGFDVVAVRVDDVAPHRYAMNHAIVRQ